MKILIIFQLIYQTYFVRFFHIILYTLYQQIIMSHKPQRFDVYTQLPDGSGFTIPNNTFIFKYDRNGGWQDQYGNYYNSDGTPKYIYDRSHEDSESQRSQEKGYDDFQQFDREFNYGNEDDEQDRFDDQQIRNLEKIQINNQNLKFYPPNKPLRIYFNNMDYTFYEGLVLQKLKQYTDVKVAIKFERNAEGLKNGKGYFVVGDKSKATEIINLEGKKFGKRNVYFDTETIEELTLDPIEAKYLKEVQGKTEKYLQKKQLIINRKKEDQPKILKLNEQQKVTYAIKKQQKQIKNQINTKVKNQSIVQLIAKQQPKPLKSQQWIVYRFNIQKFKNGDEFRNWTKSFNILSDVHYKNTKKITDNNKQVTGSLQAPEETIKILRQHKFGDSFLEFTKKQ